MVITLLVLVGGVAAQWVTLAPPHQHYPTQHLASKNGILYATTNFGTYASRDNAVTWDTLSLTISGSEIVLTPQHIFVRQAGPGVARADADGTNWVVDTAGLEMNGTEILCLYYDSVTDRIYASRNWFTYGFYYKSPSAASWTKVTSTGVGGTNATSVRGMTRAGSHLYVATGSGIFESSDGISFTQKTGTGFPSSDPMASRVSNPLLAIGNDLYYGEGGMHKSTDGGNTWSRIDKGFAIWSISGVPIGIRVTAPFLDGTSLYAAVDASPDSAYVSHDSGATWSDMSAGSLQSPIFSFARHGGKIYATQFSKDSILVWGGPATSVRGEPKRGRSFAVRAGPAGGNQLHLSWTPVANPVSLRVYSPRGRLVTRVEIPAGTSGARTVALPRGSSGLHIVAVQGGGFRETHSLVLQ